MTQPNTYAKNNLDAYIPPDCPRCAKPASFAWSDVTSPYQPVLVPMMMPGQHWCDTPGCVDDNGYNSIFPYPRPVQSHIRSDDDVVAFYAEEWKCLTCGATGPTPGGSRQGGWDHLATHEPARRRRRWWWRWPSTE